MSSGGWQDFPEPIGTILRTVDLGVTFGTIVMHWYRSKGPAKTVAGSNAMLLTYKLIILEAIASGEKIDDGFLRRFAKKGITKEVDGRVMKVYSE